MSTVVRQARATQSHRCRECASVSTRWLGRCPDCGSWGSLEPEPAVGRGAERPGRQEQGPRPLSAIDPDAAEPIPSGIAELDRVLSGGFVPGSSTLLYGEPGSGKSTLLLQVLLAVAEQGPVLLISAEESATQVASRARRLGALPANLLVVETNDIDFVENEVRTLSAKIPLGLVVVDSIQTLSDASVSGVPGSITQVRAGADRLTRLARCVGVPTVLIGHVTKGGELAGPRTLEHLVDTVLELEGDRHHAVRILRTLKHRFGPTGDIGLFQVGGRGLVGVDNPGDLLLADRRPEIPGTAISVLLEGQRPLVVELQALAPRSVSGPPRRHAQGIDLRRLTTVLAVLECRCGVASFDTDLYVSVTGGLRADEPSIDLPLALVVASSLCGIGLPPDLCAFGEVGLGGEIRQVSRPADRIAEASRFGFTQFLAPHNAGGPNVVNVRTLTDAIAHVFANVPHTSAVRPALPPATIGSWASGRDAATTH